MKINLQGKNFELTEAIKDYVLKRVTNLEKLLSTFEEKGGEVMVDFEVGMSTKHHKSGDVFHSDCLIKIDGKKFYYGSDKEDIYQAIDEVKESLYEEIRRFKDRKQTLFKRGASSVKKMLKGLSKRNPFTSKY
ncbi:MAG: ribosome-associated translation inhibitor RaiA [Candidatus Paceibacterota bacterium]|jgi:putative sigma-54 modulation protein